MDFKGIWRGTFIYEGITEYIEEEFFQIEILSVSQDGQVLSEVTENAQTKELSLALDHEKSTYSAWGRIDYEKNEMRLSYQARDYSGRCRLVELTATCDTENYILIGNYKSTIDNRTSVIADFKLSKVNEKPS